MNPWKHWKNGFDRWERTTAEYLDNALQNPNLLGPSAKLLQVIMQTKSGTRRLVNRSWRSLGLTSRDEQERTLHRINQLESHLLDLQEELEELRDKR